MVGRGVGGGGWDRDRVQRVGTKLISYRGCKRL